MKPRLLGAAVAVATFCAVADASAHAVLDQTQAVAGSYFKAIVRIGHGCEGKPTIRVAIDLPEGTVSAKPQLKPGWTINIEKKKLAQPIDVGHGRMADEVVSRIVWEGGPLPDAYFDEFAIQLKLPKSAPGNVVYFPTVQECTEGANRWVDIPDPHAAHGTEHAGHHLHNPAPALRLIEAK